MVLAALKCRNLRKCQIKYLRNLLVAIQLTALSIIMQALDVNQYV